MLESLVERLLVRTGVLSSLRRHWREDDAALRQKFEKHTDKVLGTVDKATADRIAQLARDLEALTAKAAQAAVPTDRLDWLETQIRMVRSTLELNASHRHRRSPDAFDEEAIEAHVASAIASAAMHEDPTAHLVVENLLPDTTYQALLDAIPPELFFSQKDRIKQNLRITSGGIMPDPTLEAFGFLEQSIIGRMMVPALMRRFGPYVRRVYDTFYEPDVAPQMAAMPHEATAGRLMLRRPGYHLNPHIDPKRVIVTSLIYFARPGDSEAFGTSFYQIDGTPQIDQNNTFYPEKQGLSCRLVKTVPFTRNTAVIFLNAGAAHGADIPASAPDTTERYAYQFYVSPIRPASAQS